MIGGDLLVRIFEAYFCSFISDRTNSCTVVEVASLRHGLCVRYDAIGSGGEDGRNPKRQCEGRWTRERFAWRVATRHAWYL